MRTDGQTESQKDGQTDRLTGRQTDTHTHEQTDTHAPIQSWMGKFLNALLILLLHCLRFGKDKKIKRHLRIN